MANLQNIHPKFSLFFILILILLLDFLQFTFLPPFWLLLFEFLWSLLTFVGWEIFGSNNEQHLITRYKLLTHFWITSRKFHFTLTTSSTPLSLFKYYRFIITQINHLFFMLFIYSAPLAFRNYVDSKKKKPE